MCDVCVRFICARQYIHVQCNTYMCDMCVCSTLMCDVYVQYMCNAHILLVRDQQYDVYVQYMCNAHISHIYVLHCTCMYICAMYMCNTCVTQYIYV